LTLDPEDEMMASDVRMSLVPHKFVHERGVMSFGIVGGLLLFVAVSGVLIWLLRFSAFTQVTIVVHTLVGTAAVVLFAFWQLSHWLGARKAPRSFRKICAYTGFWLLVASAVAGFVVSAQALFMLYVSPLWDSIHLWTGIAALPFLGVHFYPSARKPSQNGEVPPDLGPERRRIWKYAGAITAALLAVCAGLAGSYSSSHSRRTLAIGPAASDKNPFAPSNVETESGRPLPVDVLANSESCGTSDCHAAIYREWTGSAHRWSAEDEFFQEVRTVTTQVKGEHETEKCGACHDPVSLLSGYRNPTLGRAAPGYREGDSCVVCHAVSRMDERGIGSYVLRTPQHYLYDGSTVGYRKVVNHFLIRSYPGQHTRDYELTPLKKPESCGTCHKEFDVLDPKEGPVQVETQFEDWKKGKWNTDPDPSRRLYCQQCHMYFVETNAAQADPYDLKAGIGTKHRNHAFPAGNQYMPMALASPGAAAHTKNVEEWLRGERVVPEIAKTWPKGPIVQLTIDAPASVKPGDVARFHVTLKNEKVGHSFPTGPLNIARAWIEIDASDAEGDTLFHSGMLDAKGHIEAGSYVLKPLAIEASGKMIMKPDLWHPVGPNYRPAILAGESQTYDYEFRLPRNMRSPISIDARLRYRKANQFFMDAVYGDGKREAPITDITSGHVEIAVQ
jgi:hypothetical protein